jgi:uncharacterized protein (DUF885 family)
MPRLVGLALLVAAACGQSLRSTAPPPKKEGVPPAIALQAAADTTDEAFRNLLARHWDWYLHDNPIFASHFGDRRFDDAIPDLSQAAYAARHAQAVGFLAEAKALHVGAEDQDTLSLFIEMLQTGIDADVCQQETWNVNAANMTNLVEWNELAVDHPLAAGSDGSDLLERYRHIPRSIDDDMDNLERGAAAGRYPSAESLRKVIAMIDGQLETPLDKWTMMKPAKLPLERWGGNERLQFRRDVEVSVTAIKIALERYRNFLVKRVLPKSRPADKEGVSFLPDGDACYRALIRRHTSSPLSPDELHALGQREIARIDGEIQALGEKLFGLHDLAAILSKLRTDPTLYFETEAEVEAKAQASLDAARAKIPQFFGVLPKTDCVVRRVPDYQAPYTTIAYYRPPHADGSKPGEYMINVSQPKTRPRYEASVLAYHESIPGHHLQIALAQELPAMPAFRRFLGATAFVEGWALYTERLADEMGLYEGDLDRMGMLSYDAWRAARLVVDTGIHAKGWTREQAVQFMLAHTALAENNIRNEVDRYVGDPGQALAYKVGQMEVWRLRRDAEQKLGDKFDLKGFHDAVLRGGAVTMDVLRAEVARWVASREKSGAK